MSRLPKVSHVRTPKSFTCPYPKISCYWTLRISSIPPKLHVFGTQRFHILGSSKISHLHDPQKLCPDPKKFMFLDPQNFMSSDPKYFAFSCPISHVFRPSKMSRLRTPNNIRYPVSFDQNNPIIMIFTISKFCFKYQ